MICNSAELAGIPWETIIKVYRKQLEATRFDTLPQYAEDFVNYLQTAFAAQLDDEDQARAMVSLSTDLAGYTLQQVTDSWQFNSPPAGADLNALANAEMREQFIPALLGVFRTAPAITAMAQYALADFNAEYGDVVSQHLTPWVQQNYSSDIVLEDETIAAIIELTHAYSQHEAQFDASGSWSGLVTAGFGEKDIFPQLVSFRIGPVFGGIIRAVPERQVKISSAQPSAIEPFAQSDVIKTFWEGIDPFMASAAVESMAGVVDDAVRVIMEALLPEANQPEVSKWLSDSRPDILSELTSRLQNVAQTRNRQPMLDAVSTLSKEDLADMAESLVSLTYLKRRASFSSESVGGPVDVAVITKGEGLIWLKRKQYFRPELNLNYLSGVLNPARIISPSTPDSHELPAH